MDWIQFLIVVHFLSIYLIIILLIYSLFNLYLLFVFVLWLFVVLSSVDILNIQLSYLSFVTYICGINIGGIHVNENLINKLLWNVIDTSHSINWINIYCWLFEYVINKCDFLVWIVEFLWINVVIILIVI